MRSILLCSLSVAVLALMAGCSTWNKTVETTHGVYKSYVNVDPEIDLDKEADCAPSERVLAQAFTPVDAQLHQLLRQMETQESFPSDDWLASQMGRFSWLNGIVVIDRQGEVVHRYPEQPVKQITTDFVRNDQGDWAERQNRLLVQDNSLGAECCLTQPFFKDNVWQGLIVAHFDPRSLAGQSPLSTRLLFFTPQELLWAGPALTPEAVLSPSWQEILADNVAGELEHNGREIVWTARYIGPDPVLYAVTSRDQATAQAEETASCDK